MHELKRNAVQICNELVAVTDERYLILATEAIWEGKATALESSVGRLAVRQTQTTHPCLKRHNFGSFWLVIVHRRQPYELFRTKNLTKFYPF